MHFFLCGNGVMDICVRRSALSSDISDNAKAVEKNIEGGEISKPCIQSSKHRAILSVKQAICIFELKLQMDSSNYGSQSRSAKIVAGLYGVNEKTVRDIWQGRTWSCETWHLDSTRMLKYTRPGRPNDCKDKKARKHRAPESQDGKLDPYGKPVKATKGLRANDHNSSQSSPTTTAPKQPLIGSSGQDNEHDEDLLPQGDRGADQRSPDHSSPSHIRKDSIDAQLYRWAQGRACLHRLQDPFRDDWVHMQ